MRFTGFLPGLNIIGLVVLVSTMACAAQEAPSGYSYPVRPGTQQWRDMSVTERRAACDVPLATCRQMSTSSLIQTCLDYPLLIDLHASSSGFSAGLALVESRFTPLRELRGRADAASVLLARYRSLSLTPKQEITGKLIFDHTLVPVLLAENDILDKLNAVEQADLARTALRYMAAQRAALGLCASEGTAARIVAKVVLARRVPVVVADTSITREDLGGPAAEHLLARNDFTPEPQVLNRLVALGETERTKRSAN